MSSQTLDEFAAGRHNKTGYPSYIDGLPEDVRKQIMSSSAGHSVVTEWLHGLGYERATQGIVGNWRRRNGWQP